MSLPLPKLGSNESFFEISKYYISGLRSLENLLFWMLPKKTQKNRKEYLWNKRERESLRKNSGKKKLSLKFLNCFF